MAKKAAEDDRHREDERRERRHDPDDIPVPDRPPRAATPPDPIQMKALVDACLGPLANLLAGLERVGDALDAAAVLAHQMTDMERRRDAAQAEAATIRQELEADRARLAEDLDKGAKAFAHDKEALATEANAYRAKVLGDLDTKQAQADAALAATQRDYQALLADKARLEPEVQALHETLTQYKAELTRLKAAIPA